MRRYAVVMGEALVDLLETQLAGETVYRPAVGGAPLNVAVGIVRLGGAAELVGSVGDDAFGARIRAFLAEAGVGHAGLVGVAAPTTLAVTAFTGSKPDFHFYGDPPSYGMLHPDAVDRAMLDGAAVLSCGSIALLCEQTRAAARAAWAVPGPVRLFDPNVRPNLIDGPAEVLALTEEFAATADLVKLSADDADLLYGRSPRAVAEHLVGLGARTVVVTLGPDGALVTHGGQSAVVGGVAVRAVDTTGAGDAVMAAIGAGVLAGGVPSDLAGWATLTAEAMLVAATACETPGGAVAMPTRQQVAARFGTQP
jgi:fructokinase